MATFPPIPLHMARVRSRVARGGHDIPEEKIRQRYDQSRINLIELMPRLTELRVFDNSFDADPHAGHAPQPNLILHLAKGEILELVELFKTPQWAKAFGGRSGQDLTMIIVALIRPPVAAGPALT